jgi:alpha-beta hydrolase superfamily lysophospholipase
LLLSRKVPAHWKGMVLVAPMAKIAKKMRPAPFMISALSKLNGIIPTWKIVPVNDIFELAFKLPEKREMIKSNKLLYRDKPRIRTAFEMYETTLDLEGRLEEVTLPFLLLHGEEDTVTDPEVSKELYDQSKSFDKTMKLYKGLWHGLTTGEKNEDIDMVFNDIIQWLKERSGNSGGSSSGSDPGVQSDITVLEKTSDKWEVESESKGQYDHPMQPIQHAPL